MELRRAFVCGAIPVARSLWRIVRLRLHSCPRRERELSSDDNRFVRLDSVFDNGEVAVLSLSGFDWTQIDRVIRLQNKNERAGLADLHSLRWNEARIFDRVKNEANPHEFRRPESAIGVRHDPARLHCS